MKRIVQIFACSLALMAAVTPALGFNMTASLSRALSAAVEMSGRNPSAAPSLRLVDTAISTFDERVVEAFNKAWSRSSNGTSGNEGVVLVLRRADGSYSGIELGATNEHKRFSFRWQPETIAVIHTHPNESDPRPHDEDIAVADKHGVPIFTITSRGMYAYDPNTRKISKVADNLDWLNPSAFVSQRNRNMKTSP